MQALDLGALRVGQGGAAELLPVRPSPGEPRLGALADPLELSPGKFGHLVRTAVEDGMRTVIYEHGGEVRRAVFVFKSRAGAHERTIRDIDFAATGISIGPPLRQFRGVLTGVPELQEGVAME